MAASGEARLGIVGAGTMGAGIALVGLSAGLTVVLQDTSQDALQRSASYLRTHLDKAGAAVAWERLAQTTRLEDLAGCQVVVEAAPEDLGLKRALFTELSRACSPTSLLATNTSTLSVTAIAAAAALPERVAGMHFFNPAPLMPLVEVARGARTAPSTIDRLVDLARRLGKTPVVTADTPGFIVNRVARPFYGEALRILGEGTATHEQIDRLIEWGAGFRMGPFRLMDLIGLDVNFAATRSMWEQTFGEPRYRPHPIQARMVEQGALGRKTGRGFYNYESSQAPPRLDRPAATPDNSGAVLIGEGTWAPGLAERVAAAGYAVVDGQNREPVAALVVAGREEGARQILENLDRELAAEVPVLCQVCDQTLGEAAAGLAGRRRVFGFDGLFAARGQALCVVASPGADAAAGLRVEAFLVSLGIQAEWIADGAGLVLPRIMAMLANEAAFALGDSTADEPTIDLAMTLGANYPVGPLEWLRRVGPAKILRVLEHLRAVFAEERYRVAPLLRRWAHDADALQPGRHGSETAA